MGCHCDATSGYNAWRLCSNDGRWPKQNGQYPGPLVLFPIDVSHSWFFEHLHQAFLVLLGRKSSGFLIPFFVECHSFAMAGKTTWRLCSDVGNLPAQYGQPVPLVGITPLLGDTLTVSHDGVDEIFEPGNDYVAWTKHVVDEVQIDADFVFVGYGAVAPEYDWDDFSDVDVKGKILLFLVNDPPVENAFGGRAMTYYGRWTYKHEIAATKGAVGSFVIHEPGPAGYPWEVVGSSPHGESFDLITDDQNLGRTAIEGWIHQSAAERIFEIGGHSHSHCSLSLIPKSIAKEEIVRNKEILENITDTKIRHFSFPFGGEIDYNNQTLDLIKKIGYLSSVTTIRKPYRYAQNIFEIPRFSIKNYSRSIYKNKLENFLAYY